MGQVRASHPRFRREGDTPAITLTEDDLDILRRVHRHRFIRADDLYRLYPNRSSDKLSRRLMRLYRNGLLDRPIAQIDRFKQGGSQALVYGLDNAGARLLAERLGLSLSSGEWKARNRTYTRENLDHTLAVTTYLVDLELACRARPDLELIPFDDIVAQAPERTQRSLQPGRWPVEVSWKGGRATIQLVPDAIFGLRQTLPNGRTRRTFVFLEIDRGTMTIAPAERVQRTDAFLYRSSILRKLIAYAESHRLALHTEHLGLPIARVLLLTTSQARSSAMQEAAGRLCPTPTFPPGLFLFGESDQPPLLANGYSDCEGSRVGLS